MILVPIEALDEAVVWNSEIYVPNQDGTGQLPADLVAYLANRKSVTASPNSGLVPIRPGILNQDVLWDKVIYVTDPQATGEPPAEMLEWLQVMRPDVMMIAPAAAILASEVAPDGSRIDMVAPDLIAVPLNEWQIPSAPSGIVNDVGHSMIGGGAGEEILLEVGTAIVAG
jgi:hypothetical protein